MPESRGLALLRGHGSLLFALALAGVLVLALLPVSDQGGSDKLNHVCAFLVLGLLAQCSWPARRLRVFAGLLLLGGVIEIAQHFVGRDTAWADWLADAGGLLFAFLLWYALPARWRAPAAGD